MIKFLEWLLGLFRKREEKKMLKKHQKHKKHKKELDKMEAFPFNLTLYSKSATASRLKIDNTPKQVSLIVKLRVLHENIVVPCYKEFSLNRGKQISINSGYRCLSLNRALGSKDTSQHVKGEAVDIEFVGVSNADLAEWIYENLDFDQLILEMHNENDPSSGWVHCSYVSSAHNRNIMAEINQRGIYKFLKGKSLHH